MSERPLLAPGTEITSGSPIWLTFLIAGVMLYTVFVGVLLARYQDVVSPASAPFVALPIVLAVVAGVAGWYLVSVKSITGRYTGAWSLPEAATLTVAVDPTRALHRVLTLAKDSFVWLRWTSDDQTLTLSRKGWWGNASVEVVATALGGGTQLRLDAGSSKLVNNLLGRAIIGRLLAEIARNPDWTHA